MIMENQLAFPITWKNEREGQTEIEFGLTKREYFTGKAMEALITGRELTLSKEEANVIASQAIQFADELLKQLGE